MRYVCSVFAIVVAFACANQAYAQGSTQQFGFVDMEKVVAEMPEFIEGQRALVAWSELVKDSLAAMESDFQQQVGDYQKQRELMQPQVRQTKEQQLQQLQQQILMYQQARQQDLQERQEQMIAPIRERVRKAVSKVATEMGLQAVFDKSIPFYVSSKVDITFKVLDQINRDSN